MKFVLCVVIGVAWLIGVKPLPAAVLGAQAEDVRWEGRTVFDPQEKVWIAYPGVTVYLRFRGDRLSMRAQSTSADASCDVIIDQGPAERVRLPLSESTIVLWQQSGASGEHLARIVRRTESWMGICAIHSFETSGEFLPPTQLPERKLMFIGDSFTCGAATEVRSGFPMEGKTLRQNARLSYGMLLAERLGAQCHIVGYGGRGIIRDWQGRRDLRCVPEYYKLALPDDVSATWNPSAYIPDAICVCVGTNDFDEGIPDQTEYVAKYSEFVRLLRRDAPHAYIFLVDSPILNDTQGGVPKHLVLHAYLGQVVEKMADPRLRVITLPTYPIVPDDGHPDGAAHLAIANLVEPVLRGALDWK